MGGRTDNKTAVKYNLHLTKISLNTNLKLEEGISVKPQHSCTLQETVLSRHQFPWYWDHHRETRVNKMFPVQQ